MSVKHDEGLINQIIVNRVYYTCVTEKTEIEASTILVFPSP